MVTGSLWMLLFNAGNRGLGLISTMILARILVPEDYGLVAMSMSIYALLEIMAAFGFDVVLIQKRDVVRDDYDSAWSVRLVCYSILAAGFYFSAATAAAFYADDRLKAIIQVLAFAMLLSGFENIRLVDFRKHLEFSKEFWYQLSVKLVGFSITVPLAFVLRNYWALVIGILAMKVGALVLGYIYRPYMPRLCFDKAKEIFHFSKWLLLTNFLSFFVNNLPIFVLGKLSGSRAVGLYSIGSEIAQYSSAEVVAPINRAVFPGYAKLKNNLDELRKSYLEVIGIQALIILPLGFGLSVTAEYVIQIILGGNWGDAVAPMRILAIASALMALSSNSAYIYFVLEKPHLNFAVALVKALILGPTLIVLTLYYGLMGAVSAYLITYLITPFVHYWLINRFLGVGFKNIFATLYRPVLASLVMFGILHMGFVQNLLALLELAILKALLMAVIGAAIYVGFILGLWNLSGRPNTAEAQAVGVFLKAKAKIFLLLKH